MDLPGIIDTGADGNLAIHRVCLPKEAYLLICSNRLPPLQLHKWTQVAGQLQAPPRGLDHEEFCQRMNEMPLPCDDAERGTFLGAQKLPKTLRSLLFGRTHYEVDLTGSHYQFFSRLASTLLQLSLPSVVDFRALLREDMIATSSDFLTHNPTAPKDLPTILLNSTLGDTITHFNSLGY